MLAFISDIHGNLEALSAVFDHMEHLGVEKVFCLGDVVGYGPNPRECIRKIRETELCIKGNHEAALLYDSSDFNPQAKIALDWTRDQINADHQSREERFSIWEWIDGLPEVARSDEFMLVHGSPRDPVREYILPLHIRDQAKMTEVFDLMDRPFCFVGHSHVPGIYTRSLKYLSPAAVQEGFRLRGGKALVNVGSVGQPRDGDPRSCYCTLDGKTLRFHRVAYDIKKTMTKIMETKVLPKILALRLKDGR